MITKTNAADEGAQARLTDDLLSLSHELGSPENDWAILGEGNTSIRIDEDRFLVKASGSQLSTLSKNQVVEVRFAPLLSALSHARLGGKPLTDAETGDLLRSACTLHKKDGDLQWNPSATVNPQEQTSLSAPTASKVQPSVETLFHGMLLQLPGVSAIGHTHVTSINGLLCSDDGWELMKRGGRLFPDEVVVCGVAPCCVDYADPGLPLALAIGAAVDGYRDRHGSTPKTVYLESHGFIALGGSTREVIAITRMADKAARIMLGAIQAGGPRFLPQSVIDRIANRPDEHHRQRQLGLR